MFVFAEAVGGDDVDDADDSDDKGEDGETNKIERGTRERDEGETK